jgi:hypothetical protein
MIWAVYIIVERLQSVAYIEDGWYLLGGHCTPRIDRSSRRARGARVRFCTKVDIILSNSCSTIIHSARSTLSASLGSCEKTFHQMRNVLRSLIILL